MRPGLENAQNELSGVTFGYICGQGLEMLKMSSWGHFWPYVRPGAEMLKISFVDLLLNICAARGRKCSKSASRATFGHMCGQGLKMLEIFLGPLLAICAAGA